MIGELLKFSIITWISKITWIRLNIDISVENMDRKEANAQEFAKIGWEKSNKL